MTTDTINLNAQSPTGCFNHAAIVSSRAFDPAAALDVDRTIHGLTPEAGYVWGSLRDEDGNLYSIMRRIPAVRDPEAGADIKSLGGKLILLEGGQGSQMRLRREPRNAPDSNELVREVNEDGSAVQFTGTSSTSTQTTQLSLSPERFEYVESGVIDVTGSSLAAPPLQWFLPGPDSSLLYLTQTWLVEGRLLDRDVRGFLFWEEAWMPPNARLYVSKDPLHDAEYTTWYSWANHWDDGSSEVGHFLFGNGDFHVAVSARNDGTVSVGKSMDTTIIRDAEGYWHDGIDYTIDGERWRCEPDPHGRMEGLGPIPNPQQEGRVHRVSDTRTPDVWMAWGESVPANGERRRW